MSRFAKRTMISLLGPVAAAWTSAGEPLRRAWSHARLSAATGKKVDPSVVVLGPVEIRGTGQIQLGRNLFLYRELYLETQGRGMISLGDNVVISRGAHLVAFSSIRIGEGSMIGEYTSIRDANHRFAGVSDLRQSGHDSSAITIGRAVWIGRGVTILPGVTIGDGAVVGANAVVTRSIPAGAVVAGVPARPLAREAAS